jgi:hypothetical protein
MQDKLSERLLRLGVRLGQAVLGDAMPGADDFRAREARGSVSRPAYAYGLLRAADCARYFGHEAVTVCEFGVAEGAGLRNMVELARRIEEDTKVHFRIVGFDTGAGLPEIQGYKDHPEIWNPGDFPMVDKDKLLASLEGRAEVIFGDVKDTIGAFTEALDPKSPIGFLSIDVDIYSATVQALRCLEGPAETKLPAVSLYLDDVDAFFANDWCGELAAVHEFNAAHDMRKIGPDRSLAQRPEQRTEWYSRMFVAHVLDHPARQKPRDRKALTIDEHMKMIRGYSS